MWDTTISPYDVINTVMVIGPVLDGCQTHPCDTALGFTTGYGCSFVKFSIHWCAAALRLSLRPTRHLVPAVPSHSPPRVLSTVAPPSQLGLPVGAHLPRWDLLHPLPPRDRAGPAPAGLHGLRARDVLRR